MAEATKPAWFSGDKGGIDAYDTCDGPRVQAHHRKSLRWWNVDCHGSLLARRNI